MGTFNGLYMLIATSLTNVVASKNLPPPPSSCSERWRCLVSAAPFPRHGVLTFRTEVMSPPNRKINYFLMLRHFVTRIFWN